jgi:hypothetical protein
MVLVCAYLLFGTPFAELHISFFQAFPVFIGEIVLGLCMLLFFWRTSLLKSALSWRVLWFWVIFGVWILVKACFGYAHTGAYALRNAAMFYYSFTGLFVYVFMKGVYSFLDTLPGFKSKHSSFAVVLAVLLALGQVVISIGPFGRYIMLMLLLAFFIGQERRVVAAGGCVLVLVCAVFAGFFDCVNRAHLVALTMVVIFFAGFFFTTRLSGRLLRFLLGVCVCVLFAGLIWFRSNQNTVRSLMAPQEVRKMYLSMEEEIVRRKPFYTMTPRPTRVYNPDREGIVLASNQMMVKELGGVPAEVNEGGVAADGLPPVGEDDVHRYQHPRVSLNTAYANILYRYFIWRDMAVEFFRERLFLFGFDLGHPQRSISLEILGWGDGEWARDGWVAPHNSYLHIIYRAGVVGLGLISLSVFLVWRAMLVFVKLRSWRGACLVSVLVFGGCMAAFSVFLEVPYAAIPFWFIFGITMAHADQCRCSLKGVS